MRKCPICNQIYVGEDNEYCINDGTKLIIFSGAETAPTNISASASQPTLVISHQPPVPQNIHQDNSTWQYAVIGALVAIIFSIGAIFYLLPNSEEPKSFIDNEKTKIIPIENNRNASETSNLVSGIKQVPSQPVSNQSTNFSNKLSVPNLDSEQIRKEISNRISTWKYTAESRNLNSYMNNYADTIDYYKKRGASKNFVRNDKQRAFSKFDSIKINISIIKITPDSLGESAVALIDKEWVFQGNGYLSGKVRQNIEFRKINGEWLISGEKDLKVFYINK